MKTMGQAIDEAIALHEKRCPGSEVYSAYAREHKGDETSHDSWWVDLFATHFSCPILYTVPK